MMNKLNEYINYTEQEYPMYIPNEIFYDLNQSEIKGSSHIAFSYSYYYLISWLYRYAKYGSKKIDVGMIKEILGYRADNKGLNYLIKQNGVLDKLGYTFSSGDYPLAWNFNNGDIEFLLLSDMDEDTRKLMYGQTGRNYKIKVPVKGLWRSGESEREGYYDGTFYDISNTHYVGFDVFTKCMENEQVGVIGFYLYGYLKNKIQTHKGKYKCPVERIADDSGISIKTTERYLGALLLNGLIKSEEGECKRVDDELKREANTYYVRDG